MVSCRRSDTFAWQIDDLPPGSEKINRIDVPTKQSSGQRQHKRSSPVLFKRLTKEAVNSVLVLKEVSSVAEFEMHSKEDQGMGYKIASQVQNLANTSMGSFGRWLPILRYPSRALAHATAVQR